MQSGKILFALFFLYACQDGEFYERPAPASLEFGRSMGSSSFLSSRSALDQEEWVKIDSFDLGRQPLGTVSLFEFAFKNVGNLPANVKDIRLVGENTDKFFLTHNCLRAVSSGERCPISISYKPDTIGKMPSKVKVTYDNGISGIGETTLPISAAANNLAFLKFESNTGDYGQSIVGQTKSLYLKVLYNGSNFNLAGHKILPARGVIMADPSDSTISIDRGAGTTCDEVIKSDCVIKVDYRPNGQVAALGTIGLTYFNGAEVLKIEAKVTGEGVLGIQEATLAASNLSFGTTIVNPANAIERDLNVNFSGSVPAENVEIIGPSNVYFAVDMAKSTCGTTISGNCSYHVTYLPTATGNHSDTIRLVYKSQGTTRPSVTANLSGSAVGEALLKSDVASLSFGSIPAYKTGTKYFNLTNAGQVSISSLSALTVSDSSFSAAFESCSNLSAGATCRIRVNFNPRSDASSSANISFSYFDGKSTSSLSLNASGEGASPLVMEGSRTIDFGNIMIGHPVLPSPIYVNLGIYGTTPLTDASKLVLSTLALSNPFSYVASSTPGSTSNCRAPIDPNTSNSCSFGVALVSNTGFTADVPVTQSFSIGYTGDGGNGSGTLSFTAKMTPRLPPTLAFQGSPVFEKLSVNDSQTATFTLKNMSPYFATSFKGISISGNSDFKIKTNGCSGGVVANGTCQIKVTFNPSSAGAKGAILNYDYHDQIQNQTVNAVLSSEGSDDVTLVASATVIDFGTVFVGDVIPVKMSNISYFGTKNWTSTNNAAAPFGLDVSDCGSAADCALSFSFNPTSAGNFNTTIKLDYTPGLNSPASLSFTVKGVAKLRSASLALSPLSFPKTLNGESVDQELVLSNNGTLIANDIAIVDPSGAFTLVSSSDSENCSIKNALNPGESCKILVKFSPTQVKSYSSSLNVEYLNGSSPLVLNNNISGQGTQRIQVFAGAFQTCIIDEVGQAKCWGRYLAVQKPQDVSAMSFGAGVEVKKIAIGDKHACALLKTASNDGAVSCWSNIASALYVDLGSEVATDLTAGFEHTCALLKSGKVKCWGENTSGQIGDGLMDFGSKAVAVSAGAGHSCVLLENDSMKCWGDNFYGQLGQAVDNEQMNVGSVQNINLGSFTPAAIAASSGAFTCAVSTNGAVKCFGKTVANEIGQPFYGVLGHCWSRPVRNASASYCPSDLKNAFNSIGYYSTDMGDNLAKVNLGAGVVDKLSVGNAFSCALMVDKSVKCWGLNLSGQLGIGSQLNIGAKSADMGTSLVSVKLNRDVVQLATGYEHACAVLDDNTLKCWGTGLNNATGLNAFGMMTNTATNAGNIPSALPVVYSGK